MTEDEFIDASIAHQIGALPKGQIAPNRAAQKWALAASSGSLLWWQHEKAAPHSCNDWFLEKPPLEPDYSNLHNKARWVNRGKAVTALAEIREAGADFDIFIDMQDRRLRSLDSGAGPVQPVYSFNRLEGAVGRVLWPLPAFHSIRSPEFLGNLNPTRIPWSQKRELVGWRGIAGGRANPKGDIRQERIRLMPLLKKMQRGIISRQKAKNMLNSFPRHRFVERYHNDPQFDVGFVNGNGFILKQNSLLSHLEKPRILREDFQKFKYLIVLRGLDIGSSFFWTMNSGSLGLVMETPFSSFASCHFKPWQHYVPFREDLSDFETRLAWCQDNQSACQHMVQSAAKMCALLMRTDLREAVLRGVVNKYRSYL